MNDTDLYLKFQAYKGLKKKNLDTNQEYVSRLEFELKIIISMQFCGYFLVVWDFIHWARKNRIYVGPGRGSVVGSLVAYCLEITQVDPLKYDLLFERFINPERVSWPDIDLDFEKSKRDTVIEYVANKYGVDRVGHIGTFGFFRAKNAVRSVTKALGHPYELGDYLSKLLLNPIHGKHQSIETSIGTVKELEKLYHSSGNEATILNSSRKVEGLINSIASHASGIVISGAPLVETCPLFLGKDDAITTQWDMKNVEDVGLIKFDFLGLDTLDKIHLCIDLINKTKNIDIDIETIDIADKKVYEMLRAGEATGLFQLESSSGMRDLLVRIRPTCLEDLTALVAIFRPGPLDSPEVGNYLQVRAGKSTPNYLVPELEPILKSTNGLMIYQEQALRISRDLAGYSIAEADLLRRAIGKKKEKEMKEQYDKFRKGWLANNLAEDKLEIFWKQMLAFAEYSFNKSHAAAYALIAYRTAWLKTHFPVEWMTAVMTCNRKDTDQIIKYIAEAKRLGIKVLPPDINESEQFFSTNGKDIRFGLSPIKNLGDSPVALIMEERKNGRFTSLINFCDRINLSVVNRTKVDCLIKSGAFNSCGDTISSMLAVVDGVWEYRKQMKAYDSKLETFNKRILIYEQKTAEGKKLKEPIAPVFPVKPEIIAKEELPIKDILDNEKELLGFYVSAHPMDGYAGTIQIDRLITIDQCKELFKGNTVEFGAVIIGKSEITTKSKSKMGFLQLEDLTGQIETVLFSKQYTTFKDILVEGIPLKFKGKIDTTETDEEKIVKVSISNISSLEKKKQKLFKIIELRVRATEVKSVVDKIEKFKGDENKLRVIIVASDGSEFIIGSDFKIKDSTLFLKEVERNLCET